MADQTVEERLTELEAKVAQMLCERNEAEIDTQAKPEGKTPPKSASWLDAWYGAFQDNPDYDAAMERGAAYRRSQPTADDEREAHDLPA